ncbi:PRD domain-containing protein [Streptomyces sp. WMMB 322]|uniref:PRD domain-containing protein n=1 Tax=Streptomyces sp. WMMB 322 TaxID=1286821 RepID=UPI0006E3C1F2|nr:PRD domain-containing protein [Streptomyces sp. WMMB 322]
MEEKLALRIQLFRETGQVRAEVADFVEDELRGLDSAGLHVSEETAGMLTSHLMMALNRLMNGETLDDPAAGEHMAAELADRPDAVQLARQIAARAEHDLGTAALPASETAYLAMHLAVLTARNPAAAVRGSVPDPASAEQNGGRP